MSGDAEGRTAAAIEVIARSVAHQQLDDVLVIADMWSDYPDIGESDWDDVISAVRRVVPDPSRSEYVVAYQHLCDRSNGVES